MTEKYSTGRIFFVAGSGSRRTKNTHKNIKRKEIPCFNEFYGGLGIRKLHFLIKNRIKISVVIFLILVIKTLDPDPQVEKILDPHQINANPKPW
jgi:hypothetical protein